MEDKTPMMLVLEKLKMLKPINHSQEVGISTCISIIEETELVEGTLLTALELEQKNIKEWRDECERLANNANYWQKEFYKVRPHHYPPKLDF